MLTMIANVPMNEALALVGIPEETDAARKIWEEYSAPWQAFNVARTIASGVALVLTGFALAHLKEVRV